MPGQRGCLLPPGSGMPSAERRQGVRDGGSEPRQFRSGQRHWTRPDPPAERTEVAARGSISTPPEEEVERPPGPEAEETGPGTQAIRQRGLSYLLLVVLFPSRTLRQKPSNTQTDLPAKNFINP